MHRFPTSNRYSCLMPLRAAAAYANLDDVRDNRRGVAPVLEVDWTLPDGSPLLPTVDEALEERNVARAVEAACFIAAYAPDLGTSHVGSIYTLAADYLYPAWGLGVVPWRNLTESDLDIAFGFEGGYYRAFDRISAALGY